jgi:FAD:protein FMN transferase
VKPQAPDVLTGADGAPVGHFRAMASPWEVHVAGADAGEVQKVTAAVAEEVLRIERKYSRYRDDSVVQRINRANGAATPVDDETARLLDYAQTLWENSEGRFDISTGALRRVWTFDGSDRLPTRDQVQDLLPLVGWQRVQWRAPTLRLPAGMEIDFGGIGKEYAVDRALALAARISPRPLMINGGGDLAANAAPASGRSWSVGIERSGSAAPPLLQLVRGGIATSGDARRFLLRDGVRYSHVLDPRSGWPVKDAPHSVTVLADSCTEAGSHATLALLQGAQAERYLRDAGVRHWVQRA